MRDDEFNWRESLERLGQAAFDLVTSLGGRVTTNEGTVPSGQMTTESRQVSGFTRIRLSGFGTLNVSQTGEESLSITADESILPYLTSEVIDGTLVLGVKPRMTFKGARHLTYTITAKQLEELELTGAGTINASNIQASTFAVNVSGAGDVTVTGSAHAQRLRISGAGNYHARELQSDTAEVLISGAGNARVSARERLDATISGAGAVTYYGSPQISQRISGIGSVKPGH